jgi:hypothetical protein
LDALASIPTYVWAIVHVLGLMLAIASRGSLGPKCAFCTHLLLVASTLVVAGVAMMGYLYEQPFWAVSGCTLGAMAIATVFESSQRETEIPLQEMVAEPV